MLTYEPSFFLLIGHSKTHNLDVAKEIIQLSKKQFNDVFTSYSSASQWFEQIKSAVPDDEKEVYQCYEYTKIKRGTSKKTLTDNDTALKRWIDSLSLQEKEITVHDLAAYNRKINQNKNADERFLPWIIFGEILSNQTYVVLCEIGLIHSRSDNDNDLPYNITLMNGIAPVIDSRKEIDYFLPSIRQGGSTFKLFQMMTNDSVDTANCHAYISRFSRLHGISSNTYENVLCKIYSFGHSKLLPDLIQEIEQEPITNDGQ